MNFTRLIVCAIFILLWLVTSYGAENWIMQSISQEITEKNNVNTIQECVQIAKALASDIIVVQHMEQNAKIDDLNIRSVAIIDQNDQIFFDSNIPYDINDAFKDFLEGSDKLDAVLCEMDFPIINKELSDMPDNLPNNPQGGDEELKIIQDINHYENIIIILIGGGWDFGDVPDLQYHTYLASNGARHLIFPGFYLGQKIDAEVDGCPDANVAEDDTSDTCDDDGVVFSSHIIPGDKAFLDVTASQPGFLNAWMDFNGDGDWTDEGDKIISDLSLNIGVNHIGFDVPAKALEDSAYARFRFSSVKGLSFDGPAPDGEVEDYCVQIAPLKPQA